MNHSSDRDIALLRQMLEIRSLSGQEGPLAAFLVDEMTRRGLVAHIDGAGNAVGVLEFAQDNSRSTNSGSADAGPTVLVLGHMDTVAGEVPVRQEGDLLYGRGAVDAKGPLATFIAAAGRLAANPPPGAQGRLVVVGAVEEEAATSKGARYLLDRYTPSAVVIGEPSGWQHLTLGYKGRLLSRYRVTIPMRHTAAAGASACEEVVRYWNAVAAWCAARNEGKGAFDSLTPSLRSFTSQSDGLEDRAEAMIAFRLPPDITPAGVEEWLRATVADHASSATAPSGGERLDNDLAVWAAEPAVRMGKNNAIVRAFLPAIRSVGGTPSFKVKTGTSDMNVAAAHWDCPMLAYGPGDSALDHTPHEHISVHEYAQAIDVLTAALQNLRH